MVNDLKNVIEPLEDDILNKEDLNVLKKLKENLDEYLKSFNFKDLDELAAKLRKFLTKIEKKEYSVDVNSKMLSRTQFDRLINELNNEEKEAITLSEDILKKIDEMKYKKIYEKFIRGLTINGSKVKMKEVKEDEYKISSENIDDNLILILDNKSNKFYLQDEKGYLPKLEVKDKEDVEVYYKALEIFVNLKNESNNLKKHNFHSPYGEPPFFWSSEFIKNLNRSLEINRELKALQGAKSIDDLRQLIAKIDADHGNVIVERDRKNIEGNVKKEMENDLDRNISRSQISINRIENKKNTKNTKEINKDIKENLELSYKISSDVLNRELLQPGGLKRFERGLLEAFVKGKNNFNDLVISFYALEKYRNEIINLSGLRPDLKGAVDNIIDDVEVILKNKIRNKIINDYKLNSLIDESNISVDIKNNGKIVAILDIPGLDDLILDINTNAVESTIDNGKVNTHSVTRVFVKDKNGLLPQLEIIEKEDVKKYYNILKSYKKAKQLVNEYEINSYPDNGAYSILGQDERDLNEDSRVVTENQGLSFKQKRLLQFRDLLNIFDENKKFVTNLKDLDKLYNETIKEINEILDKDNKLENKMNILQKYLSDFKIPVDDLKKNNAVKKWLEDFDDFVEITVNGVWRTIEKKTVNTGNNVNLVDKEYVIVDFNFNDRWIDEEWNRNIKLKIPADKFITESNATDNTNSIGFDKIVTYIKTEVIPKVAERKKSGKVPAEEKRVFTIEK